MKFMTLRAFLRGGYQTITGPTMIVKRGLPLFTVMPHGSAPALDEKVVESYRKTELPAH